MCVCGGTRCAPPGTRLTRCGVKRLYCGRAVVQLGAMRFDDVERKGAVIVLSTGLLYVPKGLEGERKERLRDIESLKHET